MLRLRVSVTGAESTAEAVRAYIVGLRKHQGITIDEVVEAIRMPRRTYISWEQGHTKDIKTPFALRAVRFLRGSAKVLENLDQLTPEQAAELAKKTANMTDDELEKTVKLFESLQDDPAALARWFSYGEGLRDA